MNIVISTFGARGDVQPYLALAVGLQSAGHCVTLVTSQGFSAWIEAYGVKAHPTRFDMQAFTQQPEAQSRRRGYHRCGPARGRADDHNGLCTQRPTSVGRAGVEAGG